MSEVETCRNCNGEGIIHSGIDEAPTTVCPACDGDCFMDIITSDADTTGLCSIRDCVALMKADKLTECELTFDLDGEKVNVMVSIINSALECWCSTCRPVTIFDKPGDNRMVLCPDCGNKRCPHATYHGNACTGSNEPGQAGSSYSGGSAVGAKEP